TSGGQVLTSAKGRETNKIESINIDGPETLDDPEIIRILNNAVSTGGEWKTPGTGIFPDYQGFIFNVGDWNRLKQLLNGRKVTIVAKTALEFTDSERRAGTARIDITSTATLIAGPEGSGIRTDCRSVTEPKSGSKTFWIDND
ncbi:MAG: hypothetical protein ACRD5H_08760, partial [Nitrososphaerales archaeon]